MPTMQEVARKMNGIDRVSSQNKAFHKRSGPKMSGLKSTDMGKDLSRDATNPLGPKLQQTPVSPSANANSRNK